MSSRSPHAAQLRLLDGFELRCGQASVHLPVPARRVLALLALRDRPLHRSHVAGLLWLDSTEARASGSLRSALWKLRQAHRDLVFEIDHRLALSTAVAVDARDAEAWARQVLDAGRELREPDVAAASRFGDLLPDWYEDWVALDRERLRQLRAHALEALCGRLAAARRFGEAILVGLAAVAHEPYRESAHRALISAHLAQGNRAEAARQYGSYRRLLANDLGFAPSELMDELVAPIAAA
jgi:DNA-binding SARP family transcriptional activator